MKTVTAERLRELLSYNPETGVFTWIKSTSNSVVLGSRAGGSDCHGYRVIGIDGQRIFEHRLAWLYMTGSMPRQQIDHKDGKGDHNRFDNLREATDTINRQNIRKPNKNNKSTGFLGVYPNHRRFGAKILLNGKQHYIGTFDTPDQAHEAYVLVKRKLHPGCTL